ncbi:hypothetical protein AB0J83_03495 [Actinoplanes sp. NPDC049596]|uniref:hypothetical protein n=1 Tax=unclassified Actinoplanes TaxID=2626549 RepID=UPI00343468AB
MADVANADSAIRFAPIPLASGQHIEQGGRVQAIAGVAVMITGTDGTVVTLPCRFEHGGWWITAA